MSTATQKTRKPRTFVEDICTICGGTFDWGGAERKKDHAAWHAEVAKRLVPRRDDERQAPRSFRTVTELDEYLGVLLTPVEAPMDTGPVSTSLNSVTHQRPSPNESAGRRTLTPGDRARAQTPAAKAKAAATKRRRAEERRAYAREMHALGYTIKKIADDLGLADSTVVRLVAGVKKETKIP